MINEIPSAFWKSLQDAHRTFRRELFTKSRPQGPYVVLDANLKDVRSAFGSRSYAPNWEFSYRKKGEDLNLARVVHVPERSLPWWQYHVRGWDMGSHVEITAHFEPEPTEHPSAHLKGRGFDREKGVQEVREVVTEENFTIINR